MNAKIASSNNEKPIFIGLENENRYQTNFISMFVALKKG